MKWRQRVGKVGLSEKDVRGAGECTDERPDGEQRYDQAFANSGKVTSRNVSWVPRIERSERGSRPLAECRIFDRCQTGNDGINQGEH
jgi:hypothetical protein